MRVWSRLLVGLVAFCALQATSCRLFQDRPIFSEDARPVPSATPQGGQLRVYFTTPQSDPERPGNIADRLADYIDQTQQSIDIAAFELDNVVITEALVRAVKRKVTVRVVTDSDYVSESGITTLRSLGVPIVEDQRGALMHHKFMVFDHRAVWMGSMNFTENCAYRNNNHGLLIVDDGIAENYSTKFRWMFETRKFGGSPTKQDRIPFPQVVLVDGTPLKNYFSTHDEVGAKICEELAQAKESIHFLAFSFTHKEIGRAMNAASERGAFVSGVFENSQAGSKSSLYKTMRERGFEVYKDGNPKNMHHKCIIIDGETVIAGSFNFSASADDSNDENIVIFRHREIAQKFEEEFRRVREIATRNP
jgi:phosphatidylserine/phosphatidylglycerophosphate/cardiolipin synthase-like enzyme